MLRRRYAVSIEPEKDGPGVYLLSARVLVVQGHKEADECKYRTTSQADTRRTAVQPSVGSKHSTTSAQSAQRSFLTRSVRAK